VVVGNGNVALDLARMLALRPAELASTDVADHALSVLARSAIREIVVLGRRSPAQASFTTAELRELGELSDAGVVVDAVSEETLPCETTPRRNVELLRQWARSPETGKQRTIRLRFLTSPVAVTGTGHVEGLEVVRNRIEARDGAAVAVPTDERETIPCGLVLRSVGYRGVPLPGVPFDERRGTIANDGGRVTGGDGTPVPGVYCTGWIKRGPSGVIGTNKKDAAETIDNLLADMREGRLPGVANAPAGSVDALLAARGVEVVDYEGWRRIDEAERRRGGAQARPRVKLCSRDELLAAAREQHLAAA
jgi:ferredoxin--NADP+ reductase